MSLLMFVTHGPFTCDLCLSYKGRIYSPGAAPQLPIHPNCDCELVPIPTHEHPEINARLDDIEARLNAISLTITDVNDILHPRGAAKQVAYFEDADHVIGSPALTFDGVDTLDAALGPMTFASGGNTAIQISHNVDAPQIAFYNAVITPIPRPIATNLPTALTALQSLGLIAAPAAFPSTGILDDFNRANEGPPPGSNWITSSGLAGLVVASLELTTDPTEAGNGAATWNHELGPSAEVYAAVTHIGDLEANLVDGLIFQLGLDLQCDDPWICNGVYIEVYYSYGNGYSIYVNERGQGYVGNTGYFTLAEGDKVGLRVNADDSSVSAWRTIAGVWTEVVTGSLSGLAAAGYLGVVIQGYHVQPNWFPCVHLDIFGGGTTT